jgi:hypothetical protein
MKKVLALIAIVGFVACNNAETKTENKDTTVKAPVDTTVKAPVDTTVKASVDTTVKAK